MNRIPPVRLAARHRAALLAAMAALLVACGQTGPLYQPPPNAEQSLRAGGTSRTATVPVIAARAD